jgi:hypothetical protein
VPFFLVDDQLQVNQKPTALIELEGANGAAALGLWTMAGSLSQAKGSDGVLSIGDLIRLLLDRRLALKLANLLVKHSLWHGPDHDCGKCPPVEAGTFLFHDWFGMGYDPGVKVTATRDRRKELKKADIIEAVWLRDQGICRYCGHQMSRGDKRSDRRPTLDHVIPGLARGVTNLVLACLKCNQKKGQRTPEQAGMVLLPPPGQPDSPAETGPAAPDQNQNQITNQTDPASDPTLIPAIPHKGKVRERSGPGSGRGDGLGHVRDGPAGHAPDPGTPGRFGSPWANWTGPPADPTLSVCPYHGLHQPCRKCADATYASELNP